MAAPAVIEMPGDILAPSTAAKYLNCSAKYMFSKVRRLPDPRTGALLLGSAVHEALGYNFAQKIETGRDLPTGYVVDLYRSAWRDMAPETEFRDDEEPGEMRAQGETLTAIYMERAAPEIQPAAVEIKVSGRIGGVLVHGYVDLLDVEGRIIDFKTAARKPGAVSHDHRFQVATYTQLADGASGEARLDTLTKTKEPDLIAQSFSVTRADLDSTRMLYPLVQQSIRKAVFVPNRSSHMCSRRYCSFWRACEKEFGGAVET